MMALRTRTHIRTGQAAPGIPGAPAITWNPADKSSFITLSGGNLHTANMSAADRQARATLSRTDTSGKWYFEQKLDVVWTEVGLGMALASAPLDASPWLTGTNCVICLSNGFFGYNGTSVGSPPTFTSGQYMGLLWDAATDIYSIYKNGVLVVTSSSSCPLVGAKYPYTNSNGYGGTLADEATINFGATPFVSQPAGSTSWDGSRSA